MPLRPPLLSSYPRSALRPIIDRNRPSMPGAMYSRLVTIGGRSLLSDASAFPTNPARRSVDPRCVYLVTGYSSTLGVLRCGSV